MSDKFADDQVEELLNRIAEGESLRSICRDPRMPSKSSVYSWLESNAEFAGRFRARKAIGIHTMAEECLEIADDITLPADQKRVKIDTRLRLAGKWLPKEYGDKLDVNYNAEVTHRHDLSSYSADELDALEKLIAKASESGRDQSGASKAKPERVH